MISIPKKILACKHAIATEFFNLLDQHIDDIVHGRINYVFRIKDFAEHLSINAGHLSNIIKLVAKRSPLEFLEERLVAEAEIMLSETNLTIAEIAQKLSFQDPKAFEKLFRRVSGKQLQSV
jgi:AraC family transcriptional regulator, regulatory protein of adaptative response / methylphosphotriester-DNA alkyltransferase methyltransferase